MTEHSATPDTPHWLTDAEMRLWLAYIHSTRLVWRELDKQLVTDSGMSLGDYELLATLSSAEDDRMRMHEIADRLVTTRSGVTRAAARLIRDGLIIRESCTDDRRGAWLTLTDDGRERLAAAAPGHAVAVRDCVFRDLMDRDVPGLTALFEEQRDRMRGSN